MSRVPLLLSLGLLLFGCDLPPRTGDRASNKGVNPNSPSYFQKKIYCQKYEEEISKGLSKNGSQTLERIYYSPSLDTCVDIIYSIYVAYPKGNFTGKLTVEINDVLTERNLWRKEYPMNGPDTKTYEGVMADADQKIKAEGWGEK
jgi:hypothetical protein